MTRPRLLDLFCGAGGAAMGYHRAGFDVVGVDIVPQPHYPFEFWQADALKLLQDWDANLGFGGNLDGYDAIHASPPCQAYSNLQKQSRRDYPDLIGTTRDLLEATGLPYVIENVEGAPLRNPIVLCGSSFALGVRRHRLFESNVPLMAYPCAHNQMEKRYRIFRHGRWYQSRFAAVYGTGGGKAKDNWGKAMGIDWMALAELAEAIPPAYCELIGHQLMTYLQAPA